MASDAETLSPVVDGRMETTNEARECAVEKTLKRRLWRGATWRIVVELAGGNENDGKEEDVGKKGEEQEPKTEGEDAKDNNKK